MLTRRMLLIGAGPMALAGCNLGTGINSLYTSTHKAAAVLERALITAKTDVQKAAQDIQPYLQPIAQVIVMLEDLGKQLIAQGLLNGSNKDVVQALGICAQLAADPIVVALANTGAMPTNPVAWAVGILQLVMLVVKLTGGSIRPSAAVASK